MVVPNTLRRVVILFSPNLYISFFGGGVSLFVYTSILGYMWLPVPAPNDSAYRPAVFLHQVGIWIRPIQTSQYIAIFVGWVVVQRQRNKREKRQASEVWFALQLGHR